MTWGVDVHLYIPSLDDPWDSTYCLHLVVFGGECRSYLLTWILWEMVGKSNLFGVSQSTCKFHYINTRWITFLFPCFRLMTHVVLCSECGPERLIYPGTCVGRKCAVDPPKALRQLLGSFQNDPATRSKGSNGGRLTTCKSGR